MAKVDKAIGGAARVIGVMGTDEHGDDHDFDSHHPEQRDRRDEDGHEHGGRNETAFKSQLDALQANRGENAVEADETVGADRQDEAAEPIVDTIRDGVQPPVREQLVVRHRLRVVLASTPRRSSGRSSDRNAGVMHSHAH